MSGSNLVLGLLVLGSSAVAVWAGITDPAGGVLEGIRNGMRGEQNTKRVSTTGTAFLATVASSGGVDVVTGDAGGTGATGTRGAVVAGARGWLGVPYRWGGASRAGVDCSGLTSRVYAAAGVKLPRVSAAQQLTGKARALSAAQPGDLVFWHVPATHVAIYIGGGQVIHAPRPGSVVRIESVSSITRSFGPGTVVTVRDVLSKRRSSSKPKQNQTKPTRPKPPKGGVWT